MDPNQIAKLMKDDFDKSDTDEDFDDADLENELHGIMGGRSPSKTSRAPPSKKQTKARSGKSKPPPPNADDDDDEEGEGVPALDLNNIHKLLNKIDEENEDDDEEIDENDPALLSELAAEMEKPMPGPRQKKGPKSVSPQVQKEIMVKNSDPEPEPEPSAKEQNITKVKNLQIEYKRAALKAKTTGDKNAALNYLRVSKQLDSILNSLNADEDVDMSKLPPLDPKDLPIQSPQPDPTAAAANVEVPAEYQLNSDDASKLFNAPTSASSVMEALEQRLTKFKATKDQAVAENNSSKARRMGRIVTQMEKAIKDYKAGKPVAFDELPCPPGFPPIPVENKAAPPVPKPAPPPAAPKRPAPTVPLKQSEPEPAPIKEQPASSGGQEAEGEIPPEYQLNSDDASKLFNAPTSASSVMEALEQRLTKFKATKDQAVAENNSSKARRMGRIVAQMEKAIKDYKAGKPVAFDELPCPPGFPPIPVENSGKAPGPAPANVAPKPPQPSEKPRPPLKKQISTSASKQLNYLLERQKLFREAAIEAKKRGEIEQAKEYLRSAKGFDALIEATRSGLPIDATSIPTPPQLNEDFLVVSKPADDEEGDDSIPRSIFDIDRDEMYDKIAQELKQQMEMCIRNREYFLKMGDIPTSSKFEKYAADSKKDLHMLMIRRKNGDPIPSYRVEERTFSIVVANLDVPLNELHVEVIRAFDFTGTPNIDTYVRADFPFPSDNPQWKRTKTFHDSLEPEYNDTLFFEIDRKSRSLPRILKRHPLKLTVYAKGGFLRSDNLIGTVLIKLNDLETKCTIHECSAWTQGRKVINGRLEVKVKIREPLLAKQVEEIKEKWIVFS